MLSKKQLRTDPESIKVALKKRNFCFDVAQFTALEASRKTIQIKTQDLQNQRNTQSKSIAKAKSKGEDIAPLLAEVADLGEQLNTAKTELQNIQTKIDEILAMMPNIPHKSVPVGDSEADNVVVSKHGTLPKFDFQPKDHVDLGENRGLDFAAATKIAGTRFCVMSGKIAKLHRALTQFMLDHHTEKNGYTEVYVPYLANAKSLFGTGQMPKFEADLFKTQLHGEGETKELYLIPTAEVSLTNLGQDRIVKEADLPLKFVAHTPCFRAEAGAYGKDTRGLIRQHQFEKVELVQVVKAQDSEQTLESLTNDAEGILQALNLPYQKVILCSGDLGFSAAKTYDLEVWLPGQNCYREISSCSNFNDFQARRLKLRHKNPKTEKSELLHTINGSGLAVGRTLVAVLENYQQPNATIKIPPVLQPYMGGITQIK